MFDPSKYKVISLSGISSLNREQRKSPDRSNIVN